MCLCLHVHECVREPHFHLKAAVFPCVGLWLCGMADWGLAADWGPASEQNSQLGKESWWSTVHRGKATLPSPANTSCLACSLWDIPKLLSTRGLEASTGDGAKNHRQGRAGREFMSFLCCVSKWFGLCSSMDSVYRTLCSGGDMPQNQTKRTF